MSDVLPQSLVQQLAADGQAVRVYLPAKPVANSAAGKSESVASRPDVAAMAASYFESPDRLHGDEVGETTILKEKPIHRAMIYLHASGCTYKEIAEQCDVAYATVVNLFKQPWAKDRLTSILRELGTDQVRHFLTCEVSPSLEVLREIRDDRSKLASSRIAAANSILDRALGKPTVHVETDNTNRSIPTDMSKIDAELSALRKQVESKTGAS